MSWKAEVQAGTDVYWYTNAMRFATQEEALDYGRDLAMRWVLVTDMRVVESTDPVNYKMVDGVVRAV